MRLIITIVVGIIITLTSLSFALIYSSFTHMDEGSTTFLACIVTGISYLCLYANYEEGKSRVKRNRQTN